MSSIYLSPSPILTSKRVVKIMAAYWPISALLVSEKLVYHFCFLALCWLACFSSTHFTLPFASRFASALIPVSLRLGNGTVRLKYWRILVLILKKKQKKKTASEKMELILLPSLMLYYTRLETSIVLLLFLEQIANIHWFDVDVSVNHTYQKPPPTN